MTVILRGCFQLNPCVKQIPFLKAIHLYNDILGSGLSGPRWNLVEYLGIATTEEVRAEEVHESEVNKCYRDEQQNLCADCV